MVGRVEASPGRASPISDLTFTTRCRKNDRYAQVARGKAVFEKGVGIAPPADRRCTPRHRRVTKGLDAREPRTEGGSRATISVVKRTIHAVFLYEEIYENASLNSTAIHACEYSQVSASIWYNK